MAEAQNQKAVVNKIFEKLSGKEKEFIHSSYDEKLWPGNVPCLTMTVGDTGLQSRNTPEAVTDNLDVPPTGNVGVLASSATLASSGER